MDRYCFVILNANNEYLGHLFQDCSDTERAMAATNDMVDRVHHRRIDVWSGEQRVCSNLMPAPQAN
jgi:hypothetical protein